MMTYIYLMRYVMLTEEQMYAITERVIKAEARLDRHGDALASLEIAARESERKISATSEQIQTLVIQSKTVLWFVGIIVIAAQSGIFAAIKAMIGI
jgi:hypothetical protein